MLDLKTMIQCYDITTDYGGGKTVPSYNKSILRNSITMVLFKLFFKNNNNCYTTVLTVEVKYTTIIIIL